MFRSMFRFGLLSVVFAGLLVVGCDDNSNNPDPENPADMPYDLTIDPADFITSNFTGNDFLPIFPGTTKTYEGEDEDGVIVQVVEEYTTDTKVIMGVTCIIIHDRAYEGGELVEDTFDWFAQDNAGNVWYFGEHSEEIENGEAVNTAGSWEAGVDGALPGILMLANPLEGLWYRQEFYENEAEDVAQVLSLNASITVPFGAFTDCLQTAEWNLLEPGIVEHKYYAAGVGLVRAVGVKGESGYEDLVSITVQ